MRPVRCTAPRAAVLLFGLCQMALPAATAHKQSRPGGAGSSAAATPPAGSAARKAILDALRVPVQKELKRPVIFKVDHLRTQGEWAFMTGVPRQPGNKPMDYRGTVYAENRRHGVSDDWICALLRRERGSRQPRWRVVTYAIGATDVVWDGWDREYHAPRALFPYGNR